ncbi:MAG: hypothetical protein KY456_00830 [Chloroflexi bacterium]|nr:hypothetical protein [Chloroflexota bacterium]
MYIRGLDIKLTVRCGLAIHGAITWEKEAVFAAAALCLALSGPGAWSVDGVVADSHTRT